MRWLCSAKITFIGLLGRERVEFRAYLMADCAIGFKPHTKPTGSDIKEHKLPELPYALDALEPHLSKETLEYHYGKHHQTYITNLNNLIKGTEFENAPLEEIVKKSSGGLFNNAAQTWNHTFYWLGFTPKAKASRPARWLRPSMPNGAALKVPGSLQHRGCRHFRLRLGLASENADGSLDLVSTSNAATPLTTDGHPAF